ncbi:MAG: hypothetical protein BRD50_04205, partial [Bacteroidetes bacterium SW_11_45_7]
MPKTRELPTTIRPKTNRTKNPNNKSKTNPAQKINKLQEYNRLRDIQSALQEGTITCREVVEDYLARIRDHQALNAFIEVYEEEALQRADTIDQKIASGESIGRLYGLIMGVKDVICQQDHHVSASSAILEGFTSLYSSTAVARLLEEDAIVI